MACLGILWIGDTPDNDDAPNDGMGLGDYFSGVLEKSGRARDLTVEDAEKPRNGAA